MWDLISLIDYQFESWKATTWEKIETEKLTALIKDMQTKQCNPQAPQNKEIKSWKGFVGLTDRVKNMNTILPLISLLHSKYILDRHWKKLMGITQQNINFKSKSFCLDDLIKLELYRFADDVNELVESAQKEDKFENKLNTIQTFWEQEEFIFKKHQETYILGSMDEIVEKQEFHQMDLMTMMSSKDVEEFRDKVVHWQKTLKTVDQVISIWMKVQRNWLKLEPIFMQSEDIRAQLPEISKTFEKIDIEWKDMMREAEDDKNVVNACTFEGRDEMLNGFKSEIEICEKALDEYLQAKKKIFPRFYFVSDQALLDILSQGNNPEKVDEYLGDCFDGLKCIRFIKGEGQPVPARSADAMISNEGETVVFSEIFTCVGVVENYLCDLEKMMIRTLKDILEVAKGTAD